MITQEDYPIKIGRQIFSNIFGNLISMSILIIIGIIFSIYSNADGWFMFTEIIFIVCFFALFMVLSLTVSALALYFVSYSLDGKNLIIKSGIIARSEKILPFSKVQHVVITQSLSQRILGVATLMIQTAGQDYFVSNQQGNKNQFMGPNITGIYLKDAQKLRDVIIKNVLASKKADL